MDTTAEIVKRCISLGDEKEWFEFKDSIYKPDDIGEYISALSNAALMAGEPYGYLIWGIDNKSHKFTNTKFNYQKDHDGEPFQHYLSRNISLQYTFILMRVKSTEIGLFYSVFRPQESFPQNIKVSDLSVSAQVKKISENIRTAKQRCSGL